MLKIRSLRGQGIAVSAIVIVLFVAVAGTGAYGLWRQSSLIDGGGQQMGRDVDHMIPLAGAVYDIRFDLMQLQLAVGRASAGRGQERAAASMAQIAEFAGRFPGDVEKANTHAQALGNEKLVNLINAVATLFPDYVASAQETAQAYLEADPEAGGRKMEAFLDQAKRMDAAVDDLFSERQRMETDETGATTRVISGARQQAFVELGVLGVISVVAIAFLLFATIMMLRIVDVLFRVSSALFEAKNGNLNVRIMGIDRDDECGELQRNFNRLMDVTEAFVREAGASLDYISKGKYFRRILRKGVKGTYLTSSIAINKATEVMAKKVADFSGAIGEFEKTTSTSIDSVARSSEEMDATSREMIGEVRQTNESADNASTAAERAAENVAAVAAAAEQLSNAINEILRQISQCTSVTAEAVREVEGANRKVEGLAAAAEQIGDVLTLINDIADQTNLLALNATIEAARAGEAGKGFAVVASEVKNLANQTARATEEITGHISGIQSATGESADAISVIGGTIKNVDEIISAIAAAVEEQGAATQEIARNVDHAANGTQDVTTNIRDVSRIAKDTDAAAHRVKASSGSLMENAKLLNREIETFLEAVKRVI
jgi:methyl-accepting chemotaxis protein